MLLSGRSQETEANEDCSLASYIILVKHSLAHSLAYLNIGISIGWKWKQAEPEVGMDQSHESCDWMEPFLVPLLLVNLWAQDWKTDNGGKVTPPQPPV